MLELLFFGWCSIGKAGGDWVVEFWNIGTLFFLLSKEEEEEGEKRG
jgi:hypothetical protein